MSSLQQGLQTRVQWNRGYSTQRRGQRRDEEKKRLNTFTSDKLAWWKSQPLGHGEVLSRRERALFQGCCHTCFPQSRVMINKSRVDSKSDPASRRSLCRLDLVLTSTPDVSKLIFQALSQDADQAELLQLTSVFNQLHLETTSISRWQLRLENWLFNVFMAPKAIVHTGQLEVMTRSLRSGHPMMIVFKLNNLDMDVLAINSALNSVNLKAARVVLEPNESLSTLCPVMNTLEMKNEAEDNDALDFEMAALLELIKRERVMQLSLQSDPLINDPKESKKRVLGHLLELVELEELDDVLLVPAAVSYDPPFINTLVQSSKMRASTVRVDFDQPRSIKEFMESYERTTKQQDSECPSSSSLLSSLSSHLMSDTLSLTKLMPTSLVSFVLAFMLDSKWTTLEEIESKVILVLDFIDAQRGRMKHSLLGFSFDTMEDVVVHGLENLSEVLMDERRVDFSHVSSITLVAMAESVVQMVAMEAMVATTLASLTTTTLPSFCLMDVNMSLEAVEMSKVVHATSVLSHLLQDVFNLRTPCENDDHFLSKFTNTLSSLVSDEFVVSENNESKKKSNNNLMHMQDRMARRFARELDFLDDDDDLQRGSQCRGDLVRISLKEEKLSYFRVLVRCVQSYTNALNNATKAVLSFYEHNEKASMGDLITQSMKTSPTDDEWTTLNVRRVLITFVKLGILIPDDTDHNVFTFDPELKETKDELGAWGCLFSNSREL